MPPVLPHLLLELKSLQITCIKMSINDSLAEVHVTVECATRNEDLVRNNEGELK